MQRLPPRRERVWQGPVLFTESRETRYDDLPEEEMDMRALFAGSFDPVTLGHVDLIHRIAALSEALVVAVAVNPGKQALFSLDERVAMLREVCRDLPSVEVTQYQGLVVEAVRIFGAETLVRGVRDASDVAFELQMAQANRALSGIETLLLPASASLAFISSTMVREIARFGGDFSPFVPAVVVEHWQHRP